jgi:hypothetical protein
MLEKGLPRFGTYTPAGQDRNQADAQAKLSGLSSPATANLDLEPSA